MCPSGLSGSGRNRPHRPEIRAELLRRAERDQRVRKSLGSAPTPEQRDAVRAVDAPNTAWLDVVVSEVGWPGRELVGADGAHAAWLLAQHAELDRQLRWLPLVRAAVEAGEADETHFAYLDDRVRVREERPQRHGTQWVAAGGQHRLCPIESPQEVNAYRTALRLPPLSEHDLQRAHTSYAEIRAQRSR